MIRVSSLVVDDISTQSMKQSDAIPHRGPGTEVGGILLGTSKENEIVVDDFEPVLCEHRFGPSFRLSDRDRIGWRETLQRIRQRGEVAIVGWYRTDTRQEFALSEDDRELLDTELQPYGDVILLIKPSRSQPYEAKLFLRDDGQLRELPQATYFEFDRRAAGFLPPSAESTVRGEPTARPEARMSSMEEQLSNPGKDSECRTDRPLGVTPRFCSNSVRRKRTSTLSSHSDGIRKRGANCIGCARSRVRAFRGRSAAGRTEESQIELHYCGCGACSAGRNAWVLFSTVTTRCPGIQTVGRASSCAYRYKANGRRAGRRLNGATRRNRVYGAASERG